VRAEYRSEGINLPAVVRPGVDNPLGSRALYLGWPQYLIHGTNKPAGIGLRSSAGCIRLFPEDVELLYELVKTGVRVTVVNQPVVFGFLEGELQTQSFEILEDDRRKRQSIPPAIQKALQQRGQKIDLGQLAAQAKIARGLVLPVNELTQRLEQRLAQVPRVRNAVPIGATWSGDPEPESTGSSGSTP
jgi:L,D-transpeptidase ErfK/SrfK